MATHSGHEGVVKLGSNTIAEVVGFSVDNTGDVFEDTALADTAKTYIAGQSGWTASVECHWDETDTNGQVAMTVGATVTLNLYPEGATTGDIYYSGSAIITSISRSVAIGSTVKASYSMQGTGALTTSTAA